MGIILYGDSIGYTYINYAVQNLGGLPILKCKLISTSASLSLAPHGFPASACLVYKSPKMRLIPRRARLPNKVLNYHK